MSLPARRATLAWWQQQLLEELEKAASKDIQRILHLESPYRNGDGLFVYMGVDAGSPDGDHTTYAYRGSGGEFVIIDDPYAEEQRTFEGEFSVVDAIKQFKAITKIEVARPEQAVVKNKGPQPRTRYPRRR